MRIVFTCAPVVTHFFPLVPVARALREAGHEILFAAHESLKVPIEHAGFRHTPAGFGFNSPEVRGLRERANELTGIEVLIYTWESAFGGVLARGMARDLVAVPAVQDADLLVRDITELGGCVAAERLGMPHAAISVLSTGMTPGSRAWIKEPLNALRAEHGLPADPDVLMPFRHLTIYQAPRGFLRADAHPNDYVIRPEPFDRSTVDDALPAWVDHLPARPTVYASLGTVFNDRPEILQAFVDGLRDEPVNLILTVGRDGDPDRFGPQPPHIRIERYIPQTLLLPRCDLVLTHGGSGTVMSALTHGLPMVVVPLGADQPENAARCVTLKVGESILPELVTPESVRAAVRTVLDDPAYRRSARQLQQEIQTLPGPDHAVARLEALVRTYQLGAGGSAQPPARPDRSAAALAASGGGDVRTAVRTGPRL